MLFLLIAIGIVVSSNTNFILAKNANNQYASEIVEDDNNDSSDEQVEANEEETNQIDDQSDEQFDYQDEEESNLDENLQEQVEAEVVPATLEASSTNVSVNYRTHIQSIGWTEYSSTGVSGVTSGSNRLEAIQVSLPSNIDGGIEYSAHIEGIGWQNPVQNGAVSGTTGQSRRAEAISLELTGNVSTTHSVFYRVYVYGKGWMAWASNGNATGSSGYATQIQAVEIKVLPKTDSSIIVGTGTQIMYTKEDVSYRTHIQSNGWQSFKVNGATSGTTGQSKRIEALEINLSSNLQMKGGIQYRTHLQSIGWQDWKTNGIISGTTGQSRRIEGIEIMLTGDLAQEYSVYYRAHVQGFGWLGWTKDGGLAGSTGCSRRAEAVEIKVIPKGLAAPALSKSYSTDSVVTKPTQYIPTYYTQHDSRWGNSYYGNWSLSYSGCVPTSIAMALKGLGKDVSPNTVASYLYNSTGEYNKSFFGASGKSVQLAANYYGVKWQGLSSQNEISKALSDGKIVIAYVNPGTWAPKGATHAIVLHKNSNGNTYVYDPNTSSKNGWYNISTVWNQRSTDPIDSRGGYLFYALSK